MTSCFSSCGAAKSLIPQIDIMFHILISICQSQHRNTFFRKKEYMSGIRLLMGDGKGAFKIISRSSYNVPKPNLSFLVFLVRHYNKTFELDIGSKL